MPPLSKDACVLPKVCVRIVFVVVCILRIIVVLEPVHTPGCSAMPGAWAGRQGCKHPMPTPGQNIRLIFLPDNVRHIRD